RDAAHITQKLCILSKNFIEQKSFKIKNYLLGDLKIAKFQKKFFVEAFNSSYCQPDLRYGHEVQTPSVLRWSGRCVKISSRSVNIFNKKVSV
ncbi:MAG: hypothetical protein AAFO04_30185, partial [Cyanobacteria bacterium J06592_8]